jgi:hypothetical protein
MAALLVQAGATLHWTALEPRAVALARSDDRMRAIVGDARS